MCVAVWAPLSESVRGEGAAVYIMTTGFLHESFTHMRYKRLRTQAPAPSDAIDPCDRGRRPAASPLKCRPHSVGPTECGRPLRASQLGRRREWQGHLHQGSTTPSRTLSAMSRCCHLNQLIPRRRPHGRRPRAKRRHHDRSPDNCRHRPGAPSGILNLTVGQHCRLCS